MFHSRKIPVEKITNVSDPVYKGTKQGLLIDTGKGWEGAVFVSRPKGNRIFFKMMYEDVCKYQKELTKLEKQQKKEENFNWEIYGKKHEAKLELASKYSKGLIKGAVADALQQAFMKITSPLAKGYTVAISLIVADNYTSLLSSLPGWAAPAAATAAFATGALMSGYRWLKTEFVAKTMKSLSD